MNAINKKTKNGNGGHEIQNKIPDVTDARRYLLLLDNFDIDEANIIESVLQLMDHREFSFLFFLLLRSQIPRVPDYLGNDHGFPV